MIVHTRIRPHAKKRSSYGHEGESHNRDDVKTLVVEQYSPPREGSTTCHIPSLGSGVGNALQRDNVKYNDKELQEREQSARVRSKQRTIAPICNKGPYQVITNADDLKTMGRKI